MYYKDLLRHRQSWLGVATLWILLFHLPIKIEWLRYLKIFGYGGVDICIFASGIGCFYSLCSNSDVVTFMKRRIRRMAPTYLICVGLWFIFLSLVGELGFSMVIGNILGLQSFTGRDQDFNWYISAIFLLYLLAPYFKLIVERSTPIGKVLFTVFLLICSIPFWRLNSYMIIVTRLPIFYIGMVFADLCKKDTKLKGTHIMAMVMAFVVGIILTVFFCIRFTQQLWSHGLLWYPFILIAPTLCVGMSYSFSLLGKTKIGKAIVSCFSFIGDYSLELYLMQVLWVSMTPAFIAKFNLSQFSDWVWAAGIVALIIGSFVIRRLTMGLDRLLFNRRG